MDVFVGIARAIILPPDLQTSKSLDGDSLAQSALQIMVVRVCDLGVWVVKNGEEMRKAFLSNSLIIQKYNHLESEYVKVIKEISRLHANLVKLSDQSEELDKNLKGTKQAEKAT
ncbi:unnamed protein product [Ilex paraguariensis]|uniref:Uncharacterized protein n=1 Tax=Ilex paraguariensis TaxID=185542 RepID=A0ABC8R5B2_9AQUA